MSGQEREKIERAVASALQWLAMLDEGRYDESWQNAAQLLKSAISESQFTLSLEGTRGAFGALRSRSIAGSAYHTELPGAPDGEYVVIQFEASCEHKKNGVETVTPMLDDDAT